MAAAVALGVAWAGVGSAQVPPLDLPSDREAEIPFRDVEPATPQVAPRPAPSGAGPQFRFRLRAVRVVGNSVLEEAQLREVAAPYVGGDVGQREIEAMRAALTRLLRERGYVTSGALVPDQDLVGGELVLRVVEGRVAEVRFGGLERFSASLLRRRVWPDPDAPLHLGRLADRLSILQLDPDIERVEAELLPGSEIGESILHVRLVEGNHLGISAEANNYRAPSIGAYTGVFEASVRNRTGARDRLDLRTQIGEGLWDVAIDPGLDLGTGRTRLSLPFRIAESEVVESPFDVLDIESEFLSAGAAVSHTVFETFSNRVDVALRFDWRRARTRLGGSGFSFSEGADEGETIVAPLRLDARWTHRRKDRVVALRALLSRGLPVLDATDVRGAEADASYTTWLLQGQLAHRLPAWGDAELFVRGDLQLADAPLLTPERFSIGGHVATRGFRENQVVTDQGVSGSLEVRFPFWRRPDGTSRVQLGPFVDVGHGWDHPDRSRGRAKTLASAGLALRFWPHPSTRLAFSWAQRLTKASRPRDDKDLQDYGLHFAVTTRWD